MENQKITSEELFVKMEKIRELTPKVFSATTTETYRQKVIYNLLSLVKAADKEKFLWTLLRLINARKEDNDTKKLVSLLNELYILNLSRDMFERWAYAVIMGIMSVKSQGGGE
jgi:hypothetical protein